MIVSSALLAELFVIALFTPLIAAAASLILRRASWHNTLTHALLGLSAACGLLASGVALFLAHQGVFEALPLFELFGTLFVVGPLSALFLSFLYLGVLLTSLYSVHALPRYAEVYSLPWLNTASAFFIVGMQATLMASGAFSFLIAWEVMSVAAYFLVVADREEDSMYAGFLYFVMTHLGFAALLAGFLILSGGQPFATWADMAFSAAALSPALLASAFVLLFIGFGSKAGLVPLHQWLPYAHPQAPSASSALLSGVMLKVALFGFLQSLLLFPYIPLWWGIGVAAIGLLSALFGVLHAAVERDAKRLLAWSSVENMGLIFSGVGVVLVLQALPPEMGLWPLMPVVQAFVLFHAFNHFVFKSGLFMAVGAVVSETHTRDLDLLGGFANRAPLFSGAFLVLALSAAALPPFGTFFGEWAYLQSLALALSSSSAIVALSAALMLAVVALVGGLAIFSFVRLFSALFLGRARSEGAEHAKGIAFGLTLPPLVLATLATLSGFFVLPLFLSNPLVSPEIPGDLAIAPGVSINAWWLAGLVLLAACLLIALRRFATNTAPARITDTWDCGQPLTPRMEYTATGFSAPIRFFFRTFLVSRKHLVAEPVAPGNPWISRKHLEWDIGSFWEYWVYGPVASAVVLSSRYVKKMQSGIIQLYLLFVLIALLAVLTFAV